VIHLNGQEWGRYGLSLSHKYIEDVTIIDKYINITKCYLNRLYQDFILCWDLAFTDDNTQWDCSSVPIAMCGMLEMMKHIDINKEYYQNAVNNIIASLIQKCTTKGLNSNGILTYAFYGMPLNLGIDECTMWGDYFLWRHLLE
jgi:unsaturated chondroitin disaccharide hydrolase